MSQKLHFLVEFDSFSTSSFGRFRRNRGAISLLPILEAGPIFRLVALYGGRPVFDAGPILFLASIKSSVVSLNTSSVVSADCSSFLSSFWSSPASKFSSSRFSSAIFSSFGLVSSSFLSLFLSCGASSLTSFDGSTFDVLSWSSFS